MVLALISMNIGCDQVSKQLVRENVATDESFQFLSNHLTVTRLENRGAFLSLGDSLASPLRNVILSVLPLLALTLGLFYILTRTGLSNGSLYGACFIIGGGIGNIFDRISYGSVTDFLYIHFSLFHTGVFNLADTSIMTGSFIILFHHIMKRKNLQ
jgi:signal peptidase II